MSRLVILMVIAIHSGFLFAQEERIYIAKPIVTAEQIEEKRVRYRNDFGKSLQNSGLTQEEIESFIGNLIQSEGEFTKVHDSHVINAFPETRGSNSSVFLCTIGEHTTIQIKSADQNSVTNVGKSSCTDAAGGYLCSSLSFTKMYFIPSTDSTLQLNDGVTYSEAENIFSVIVDSYSDRDLKPIFYYGTSEIGRTEDGYYLKSGGWGCGCEGINQIDVVWEEEGINSLVIDESTMMTCY